MSERVRRELEGQGVVVLDGELEQAVMDCLLRRVNQARIVLGFEPFDELPEESCEPDSACHCVLGTHLHNPAMYESIRFRMPGEAEKVAAAWGTELNDPTTVALPKDLRLATAAFDHGMLPDLIDPDLWESGCGVDVQEQPDLELLAEAASPHGVK